MSFKLIWVRSPKEVWTRAEVISISKQDNYLIKYPECETTYTIEKSDTLEIGEDNNHQTSDLTDIPHLNEANILEIIHQRYQHHQIYTRTGEVLLAVNPFRNLDLYNLDTFRQRQEQNQNLPHVYHNAQLCLNRLAKTNLPQSILVSGESGAGKTQSTKYIMKYLSSHSTQHYLSQSQTDKNKNPQNLETRLLDSNPILESFGNSKTRRNANSSRFGKYVKIYFHDNIIQAGNIETYLLENIRLTDHHPEELNFHFTYSLVNEYRDKGLLPQDIKFHYAQETIDPYLDYQTTLAALQSMDFSPETIQNICELTLGCLSLGNFTPSKSQGSPDPKDHEVQEVPQTLEKVAEYFGLAPELLTKTLTSRTRTIGQETIVNQLEAPAILASRDTLAKAIYQTMFGFLVGHINQSISGGKWSNDGLSTSTSTATSSSTLTPTSISILDIFGFEVFTENGFEQLCINYTNERLQCLFNQQMILTQQKEYQQEGLTWETVAFTGNEICLEQLEKQVFPLLDEATRLTSSGDQEFVGRLKRSGQYSHLRFPKQDPPDFFTVTHFAGDVDYQAKNFTERNSDAIHPQLIDLLLTTQKPLLHTLTKEIPRKNVSSLAFKSISYQFRNNLNRLVETLKASDLHYIRCLKPNDQDQPNSFDRIRIVEQLRYSGVLEAVKVARAGYPIKMKHREFQARYQFIPDYNQPKPGVVKGTTKFFLKSNAYHLLEDNLLKLRENRATQINSQVRCYQQHRRYQHLRQASIRLQSQVRRWQAHLKLQLHLAGRRLQSWWRGRREVTRYRLTLFQITKTQCRARQYFARRQLARLKISQFIYTRHHRHFYKRQHQAAITITGWIRLIVKKRGQKVKRAQQELDQKNKELEILADELSEKRENIERQNQIIKDLQDQQELQKKDQDQKQQQVNKLIKKYKAQEKRTQEISRKNEKLEETMSLMQESVRRNNGTKLEILGEMETLVQENVKIKEKLEEYHRYITEVNEANDDLGRCLIQ